MKELFIVYIMLIPLYVIALIVILNILVKDNKEKLKNIISKMEFKILKKILLIIKKDCEEIELYKFFLQSENDDEEMKKIKENIFIYYFDEKRKNFTRNKDKYLTKYKIELEKLLSLEKDKKDKLLSEHSLFYDYLEMEEKDFKDWLDWIQEKSIMRRCKNAETKKCRKNFI